VHLKKIKQEKSLLGFDHNYTNTQNKIYENSLNRRNRIHWKTVLPILIGQIYLLRDAKRGFSQKEFGKVSLN
jgi:hypothetical protein